MSVPPWLQIDEYRSGSSRAWRFTCARCRTVRVLAPAANGCRPDDQLAELTAAHRSCNTAPTIVPDAATKA